MTLKTVHPSNTFFLFGERLKALRGYASLSRADGKQQFGILEVTLKSWELICKDVSPQGWKRILEALIVWVFLVQEWLCLWSQTSPFVPYIDDKTTPIKSSILEKRT